MPAPVRCPHCHGAFQPAAELAGGIANCPRCGKAVEVPGLRDPIWRLLQIGALVLVVGLGMLVGEQRGVLLGAATALGTAALLWLLSRCL